MTDLEKDKILLLADGIGKIARELQSIKRLLKEIAVTPQNERSNLEPFGVADRKTENSSEKPNNCEPQTYVINPQEPTNDEKCFECDDFFTCGGQCNKIEDEPHAEIPEYAEWKDPFNKMTDCSWK